ncbi:MAG: DUF4186 domain-containing protein [Candidatus Dadabacteria bacterium]|nr:DUF4186 domain-containing protein [Candidatus Dadabacteria bacterium]NIS09119.1 DUF4186 domain-containing protein [Candidatus Dadabacteria bacterium]NIV41552.1 DUF4186 family protein [Candidatus Dadabacteria bacterium]NIX15696.1 DUF4186 family protein [Candidatus Dadabacteria bacterium]NIY22427.1 DUF4186 family protein [Candidatus Dadabacteria bacterium]
MGKDIFERQSKTKFRSKFKLRGKELEYFKPKGMDEILSHARDFITSRLAPADIPNDGKQTPFRNHPVFVAQHATATCCRGCLEKWYRIKKGKQLTDKEVEYVVKVIEKWLENQYINK